MVAVLVNGQGASRVPGVPALFESEPALQPSVPAAPMSPPSSLGAAPYQCAGSDRGKKTILLAEDQPGLQRFLRIVLTNAGYRVLSAYHATQAVHIAQEYQGPIDLLLTDIFMPDISGVELAVGMRMRHPEIKILYISGVVDRSAVFRPETDRTIRFLQKPVSTETLLETVRALLWTVPEEDVV
ncbi:MAG: response regulator [Nitrospirota bacterium]